MPAKLAKSLLLCSVLAPVFLVAQPAPNPEALAISTKALPKANFWEPYTARLQATGGIEPYHWHVAAGSLPNGVSLNPDGTLTGICNEPSQSEFTIRVTDNSRPPNQLLQKFALVTDTPLAADWSRKAQVSGQRIDGSIRVSNRTGRDFDLTFVVLAVNGIGRATAIGYQHFPLKKDTKDMEIPFGDSLSPGDYYVNVDVVGEEPVSKRIFRARLVTGKESVTQGP